MSEPLREDIEWGDIRNSWDLRQAIGQPPARISVRNLQAIIQCGKDAWGRDGKAQPVLISATISLRKPFSTASAQDTVNASTIHYGILSKAILEAINVFRPNEDTATDYGSTLHEVIGRIVWKLAPRTSQFILPGSENMAMLDISLVRSVELEVTLPKALLNSTTGVSCQSTSIIDKIANSAYAQEQRGMSIVLRDLRVSTVIGVNSNERLAKQIVIANIELDVWLTEKDVYNELEEIAVKTIEESSFQTLESLASHLAWRMARYCVYPHFTVYFRGDGFFRDPPVSPNIKISFSKPTAVTLADAPEVEITVASKDLINRASPCKTTVPFPLQGRLDEWIKEHDMEGLTEDPVLGG